MKTKEQLEEELHKPYLDVPPLSKEYKMPWSVDKELYDRMMELLKSLPPHPPEDQKPKKEPRWFVVHDDAYDCYVSEHHTKKEALADMKGSLSCCWLIKGKIVK